VRAGKTTGLAIGESKRLPGLPDVPTIAETVPGFDFSAWIGLYAPAKTPPAIVARLSQATKQFLEDPDVQKYFRDQFINASYKDGKEFEGFIKVELDKWANVIKTQGIKAQ
jgi:tripartite-type tricarboxylate transporter receptor subunit TctC